MSSIVNFKKDEIKTTNRAVMIPITQDDHVYEIWWPKSQILNKDWEKVGIIEIPDWLYNKKIEEYF